MRAFLVLMSLGASVSFASGQSVCLEWSSDDAGVSRADASVEALQTSEDGGTDAGAHSIYAAPGRRCLRYGYRYPHEGCSTVPGGSVVLALMALVLARCRR